MKARRSPGPLRHVPRVRAAILSVFLVLFAILASHSAASASEMSRPVSFARFVALERTTTTGLGCFGTSLTSCNGRAVDKFEIRRARTYTYDAEPLSCTALDGVDQRPALGSVASKCGPRLILGSRENDRSLGYDEAQLLRVSRSVVATKPLGGLDDLATRRAALGAPPAGPGVQPTLSRLDVDGMGPFYGTSAHGQPVTLRVNPISRTHAETDVMQQLANAGGANGAKATLYIDHPGGMCGACGRSGAVKSMARQAGVSEVTVVWPGGSMVIKP